MTRAGQRVRRSRAEVEAQADEMIRYVKGLQIHSPTKPYTVSIKFPASLSSADFKILQESDLLALIDEEKGDGITEALPVDPKTCQSREERERVSESCAGRPHDVQLKLIKPPDFNSVSELKPSEAASYLVDNFLPKAAPIMELQATLQAAQSISPDDKQQFVTNINRLLDVFQLRIKADDGQLYRLRVLPGASDRGYIQLSTTGKSRGFKNARFQVISAPTQVVRQRKPQP